MIRVRLRNHQETETGPYTLNEYLELPTIVQRPDFTTTYTPFFCFDNIIALTQSGICHHSELFYFDFSAKTVVEQG
jgi:hypothetical protein